MSETQYDLIILGGGPGGYLAAERAGAEGKKVLLVEQDHLGGVCLNEGCIPTKTLLNSAKLYHHLQHSEQFGVTCSDPVFDLKQAMAWKQRVVETLRKGIAFQMKQHAVEVVTGRGELVGAREVQVDGRRYPGQTIIVATGSSAVRIPIPGAEQPQVMTNREILELKSLPQQLTIIGGGIIGLEFATFFSRVGVRVTVVELLPEVAPVLEPQLAAMLRKSLPDVNFILGAQVTKIDGSKVYYQQQGKPQESLPADTVLQSVGRRPNCADIGLEGVGIEFDRSGIRVNDKMQTNIPGVYAVGDVNGKSLLAHSAYRMGEVAVNVICGRPDHLRLEAIPSVVYTDPEVAVVGLTETQAKEQGRAVRTARLPLKFNGRSLAEHGDVRGLCTVVVDADTSVLLGVQMLGTPASEIIFGAAAMIEAELRVQDIKEIVFPHPSVSEILRDTLFAL